MWFVELILGKNRSSHRSCSVKKGVFKDFAKFTEKSVLESLFNKVAGLSACNFIKKKRQPRCFPVKSAKSCEICEIFWRTSRNDWFLAETGVVLPKVLLIKVFWTEPNVYLNILHYVNYQIWIIIISAIIGIRKFFFHIPRGINILNSRMVTSATVEPKPCNFEMTTTPNAF